MAQEQSPLSKSVPKDQDPKWLNLCRRKSCSASAACGYGQAVLATPEFLSWDWVTPFFSKVLPRKREMLRDVIKEGQLVAKMVAQAVMDTSDTAAGSMAIGYPERSTGRD